MSHDVKQSASYIEKKWRFDDCFDAHLKLPKETKDYFSMEERIAMTSAYDFGLRNPDELLLLIKDSRAIRLQSENPELKLENAIDFVASELAKTKPAHGAVIFDGLRVFNFSKIYKGNISITIENELEEDSFNRIRINMSTNQGEWIITEANRTYGKCNRFRKPTAFSQGEPLRQELAGALESVRRLVGKLGNLQDN